MDAEDASNIKISGETGWLDQANFNIFNITLVLNTCLANNA